MEEFQDTDNIHLETIYLMFIAKNAYIFKYLSLRAFGDCRIMGNAVF